MVGIKYIGNRETHHDNLYGTALTWESGQVHNVDDAVAAKMLAHADTYEKAKPVKGEEPATVKPAESVKLPVPLPNLEAMGKDDLMAFAQQHYGENLHFNMNAESMRAKIMTFIQGRGR